MATHPLAAMVLAPAPDIPAPACTARKTCLNKPETVQQARRTSTTPNAAKSAQVDLAHHLSQMYLFPTKTRKPLPTAQAALT